MPNIEFIRHVGYGKWAQRWLRRQFRKRVLKRPSRITLPTGLTFVAPIENKSGSEVLYTAANMDWGSERLFAEFADVEDDFFDVGAHIGYYTAYLSPLVRHVYAFEPDPRNFPGLALNLPANATHVPLAVTSSSGELHLDQTHPSGEVSERGLEIEGITIDDFVGRTPDTRPRLMKLDIEGHEMAAIAGMEKTVERCQPLLLIEFARSSVNTPAALRSWLSCTGYAAHAYTPEIQTGVPPALEIGDLEAGLANVKMIFLVPPRLQHRFA